MEVRLRQSLRTPDIILTKCPSNQSLGQLVPALLLVLGNKTNSTFNEKSLQQTTMEQFKLNICQLTHDIPTRSQNITFDKVLRRILSLII